MKVLWAFVVVQFVLGRWVDGFEDLNVTELFSYVGVARPLMVPLTLIPGAAAKGAGIFHKDLSFSPPSPKYFLFYFILITLDLLGVFFFPSFFHPHMWNACDLLLWADIIRVSYDIC